MRGSPLTKSTCSEGRTRSENARTSSASKASPPKRTSPRRTPAAPTGAVKVLTTLRPGSGVTKPCATKRPSTCRATGVSTAASPPDAATVTSKRHTPGPASGAGEGVTSTTARLGRAAPSLTSTTRRWGPRPAGQGSLAGSKPARWPSVINTTRLSSRADASSRPQAKPRASLRSAPRCPTAPPSSCSRSAPRSKVRSGDAARAGAPPKMIAALSSSPSSSTTLRAWATATSNNVPSSPRHPIDMESSRTTTTEAGPPPGADVAETPDSVR